MSIFGVNEAQVRLIIQDELKQHNLDKQTRTMEAACRAAIEANAEAIRANRYENARRIARAPQPKCIHKRLIGGRSIRIACDGSCMSKQERYQDKLKQVRTLSSELAIGERRLASLEFELKHYVNDGYTISAMHHACLSQNIQIQLQDNGKLFNQMHKILDELSTLNVI